MLLRLAQVRALSVLVAHELYSRLILQMQFEQKYYSKFQDLRSFKVPEKHMLLLLLQISRFFLNKMKNR